jgi:hypothetical protein
VGGPFHPTFNEKHQTRRPMSEIKRTSFEIKYVFAPKDGISQDKMDDHLNKCSKSKMVDWSEGSDECTFCKKLLSLDRYWDRTEIENLSQRLGYSVYDNPGGRIDSEGIPSCIFTWKREVVIKK